MAIFGLSYHFKEFITFSLSTIFMLSLYIVYLKNILKKYPMSQVIWDRKKKGKRRRKEEDGGEEEINEYGRT